MIENEPKPHIHDFFLSTIINILQHDNKRHHRTQKIGNVMSNQKSILHTACDWNSYNGLSFGHASCTAASTSFTSTTSLGQDDKQTHLETNWGGRGLSKGALRKRRPGRNGADYDALLEWVKTTTQN